MNISYSGLSSADNNVQHVIVQIEKLSLEYQGRQIFDQLNFSILEKKWVALLGESGVGKSSLLRLIAGLGMSDCDCSGEILFSERRTGAPSSGAARHLLPSLCSGRRQSISYMAQTDLLLPWLSVLDNALLPAKLKNSLDTNVVKHAVNLLGDIGLRDSIHLFPHQLSGGMRQRVALARTILDNKSIVLMDEPFSALDVMTRQQLQNLAAELLRDKTVIFITHDPAEALRLADQIYVMRGSPANLHLAMELSEKTLRGINENAYMQLLRELERG